MAKIGEGRSNCQLMRTFRAQPALVEGPIPVLEKVHKPLTLVQDFNLQVDQRAADRAEFDKKIHGRSR